MSTQFNFFRDYIETYSCGDLDYETIKLVESFMKNRERFDDNDWKTVINKAKENEVFAFVVIDYDKLPINVRGQIMNAYKQRNSFPYFVYNIIHKQNLTEIEAKYYAEYIKFDKKIQALLMRHEEMGIERYRCCFEPPLSPIIANELVELYEKGDLLEALTIQYRYADFKSFGEKIEQKIFEKITTGQYNEDIVTKLASNPNLSTSIKNKIFNYGCDVRNLVDITYYMAEEIYKGCIETMSYFKKEDNKQAMDSTREIFIQLLKSKKLPVSCEMDFILNWSEIKNNGIDDGVFSTFLENCQHPSGLEICCDMGKTSPNIATYILSNEDMCNKIDETLRQKALDKLISYYHMNKYLSKDVTGNHYNNTITTLISNTSITPNTFLILEKYKNPLFTGALLQSSVTHEKILRNIKEFANNDYIKFCADVNLEMRKQGLQNHITYTFNSLLGLINRIDHIKRNKTTEQIKKNLYLYSMRFFNKEDMNKTFDILDECSQNYEHLKDLKHLIFVFKTLQKDKFEKEKHYYNNPYFNFCAGVFVADYEKMSDCNYKNLKNSLSIMPTNIIENIQDDLIAMMNQFISECAISTTSVDEKANFAKTLASHQYIFNAVGNILSEKKYTKEKTIEEQEVEF